MLARATVLVTCLALSSGCVSGMAAARNKKDPLNVLAGLPLDVVLSCAVVAGLSAATGDGFHVDGGSAVIGSVVIMTLDVLTLPAIHVDQ